MQIKLKALFLFFNLTLLLPLTEEGNENFFWELINNDYDEAKSVMIIGHIEKDEHHTYIQVLGAGSYGVVMKMEDKEGNQSALKFQFDDKEFSDCKTAYKAYYEISSMPGAGHILAKTLEPVYHTVLSELDNKEYHYCTIEMEIGTSAYFNRIFNTEKNPNKDENTDLFYDFVTETVDNFRILHFNCHFYHGDVKPENIIFVADKTSNRIGSRIIDLDLTFKSPEMVCEELNIDYYAGVYKATSRGDPPNPLPPDFRKKCNPNHLIYNLELRAPELRAIVPTNTYDENQAVRKQQKEAQFNRVWDKDFKEEAYAVGIAIDEIVTTNQENIEMESRKIEDVKFVIGQLTKSNVSQRWDMSQAYNFLTESRNRNHKRLI